MASIYKRGKKVYVIYNGIKKDGSYGQIWDPCENEVDAQIKKAEIELAEQIKKEELRLEQKKAVLYAQSGITSITLDKNPIPAFVTPDAVPETVGSNITPAAMLFSDLAKHWFDIYPVNNWSHRMFDLSVSLYKNHIQPYFGKKYIKEITPLDIEEFMAKLKKTKVKRGKLSNKTGDQVPCLSSSTCRSIYLLVSQIFDKAVEWGYLSDSPVKVSAPKKTGKSRDIWDVNTIYDSLNDIKHPMLHLGIHMSFVCTMRIGECCGLTWDCVDFRKDEIYVSKTIQRISKSSLTQISEDEIFYVFPEKQSESKSSLVLKAPKTTGSERILYMTKPLKKELWERKIRYDKLKDLMGTDFTDHNLVFSLDDGTPIEPHLLEKWFKKWQQTTSLPLPVQIDFHSMRHSSTTYKLKISNGDIKSVQGDTGHSSAGMVVNTYAHMQDENRHNMMKTLEGSFYSLSSPVSNPISNSISNLEDLQKMVLTLQPELRNQLFALFADNAQMKSISN